ncbi:MAG: DUF5011 domain-containing protein, partial [Clostridia bacterium]|nr:DUF5011 domain-containing protein [Clostridia bacterium]
MSKTIQKSRVVIVAILISMMIAVVSPLTAIAATDTAAPVITPLQQAGEIAPESKLHFDIKDETRVYYVYYAWDRRTDGNSYSTWQVPGEVDQYTFEATAPKEEGLHEFSIAALDINGKLSLWKSIPYIVTNNPTGAIDTTKPVVTFNVPDEYPSNGATIPQGMPITFRASDNASGIYYIGWKWTTSIESFTTGANLEFRTNEVHINAPEEPGDYYLQIHAVDGSDNVSKGYMTRLTVKDMVNPELSLNGPAEVDVPLGGTYDDPGATFTDNYDEERIVQANEVLDTSKVGPQILSYSATDNAGNPSNTVYRKVTVVGDKTTYELTAPSKYEYKIGEEIDLTDAVIKVIDKRGNISYETPTASMFSNFTTDTKTNEGEVRRATFSYETSEVIYKYIVKDFAIGIQSVTEPTKTIYKYGEELDLTDMKMTLSMKSGETQEVDLTKEMITGYNPNQLGEQDIFVSYEGMSKYIGTVNVVNYVDKIELDENATVTGKYGTAQEDLTIAGNVIATKADGTTETVALTAEMLSGYNANTLEEQTLTVTYAEKTTTIKVTLSNPVESIELDENATVTGKYGTAQEDLTV